MKKLITSLTLFAVLLIAACKKDEPAPTVITTRVGNVYDDSSGLSTLYYYSPSSFVKGHYDNGGRYSYIYHYTDKEGEMKVVKNGLYAYSVLYFWNDMGLADSSVYTNSIGGIVLRKKYEYDANKFLVGVKWYKQLNALVLTENFSIINNNVTQHTYSIIDSTDLTLPSGVSTYEYYTDKVNTLSNVYYGQTYLGESSANAVKSWTYTDGVNTSKVNYVYNYENEYISSQIIYADSAGVNGAQIDSLHFSYYIQ